MESLLSKNNNIFKIRLHGNNVGAATQQEISVLGGDRTKTYYAEVRHVSSHVPELLEYLDNEIDTDLSEMEREASRKVRILYTPVDNYHYAPPNSPNLVGIERILVIRLE